VFCDDQSENRYELFHLLSVPTPVITDTRTLLNPNIPLEDLFLSVSVKEINFTSGSFEPYFISMSLYDLKERRKFSETFHTCINEKEFLSKLQGRPVSRILTTSFRNVVKF
jgi:hypothetical protein